MGPGTAVNRARPRRFGRGKYLNETRGDSRGTPETRADPSKKFGGPVRRRDPGRDDPDDVARLGRCTRRSIMIDNAVLRSVVSCIRSTARRNAIEHTIEYRRTER